MENRTVGERIRYFRSQKHLTQKQLANKLNVCISTVSFWENDKTEPDIKAIIQLSVIFQITTDKLLTGKNLSD